MPPRPHRQETASKRAFEPKRENEEAARAAIVFVALGSVTIYKEKFSHSGKPLPVKTGDGHPSGQPGPFCAWTRGGFGLRRKCAGDGRTSFHFPSFSVNKPLTKALISSGDPGMSVYGTRGCSCLLRGTAPLKLFFFFKLRHDMAQRKKAHDDSPYDIADN